MFTYFLSHIVHAPIISINICCNRVIFLKIYFRPSHKTSKHYVFDARSQPILPRVSYDKWLKIIVLKIIKKFVLKIWISVFTSCKKWKRTLTILSSTPSTKNFYTGIKFCGLFRATLVKWNMTRYFPVLPKICTKEWNIWVIWPRWSKYIYSTFIIKKIFWVSSNQKYIDIMITS